LSHIPSHVREEDTSPKSFGLVNDYIKYHLLSLDAYCIIDLSEDVTVFWKDIFLEEQTEDKHFFTNFFDTQLFRSYIDKKMKDHDRIRRAHSPVIRTTKL